MNKNELVKRLQVLEGMDNLNEDELKEMNSITAQLSALKAKSDAKSALEAAQRDAEAENEKKIQDAVNDAVKKEREKFEAENRRPAFGDAPYQAQYSETWKYDNLDGVELSLVIDTLKASNKPISVEALKAMALRVGEMKDDNTAEGRKGVNYVKGVFKSATGIDPSMDKIESAVKAWKAATDPMYTGGSTVGADWVGAAYSNELWRVIRANVLVAAKIPAQVIPDNYPNLTVPLESTDPSWYKVAEATASDGTLKVPAATITASQAATASKSITVGKLGARVLFTGEMVEDSLIAFVPTLRSQLEISGAEILESLMIDGDVETSANKNINTIDGTPNAADYFLIADGFRKLALVTNTANSRSAGGVLTITDYIDTLKLMGTAGLAGSDPSKVAFIVDGNVHYANMKLPEVATRDVNSAATVENGFLRMAYSVPIIPSWQMHRASTSRLANTAGKVATGTPANNTTGAILAIRFDQWKQAFKRRMTMETTRIANADSWEIVALARWGMAYRDNEASAISYNVGV